MAVMNYRFASLGTMKGLATTRAVGPAQLVVRLSQRRLNLLGDQFKPGYEHGRRGCRHCSELYGSDSGCPCAHGLTTGVGLGEIGVPSAIWAINLLLKPG